MAKGYEHFLESAARIREKVRNARFLIVGAELQGKQKYMQKLRDLVVSLGLGDHVILAGFREDIPEILSMLDVFVLSSVSEACPVAVLEALAMRLPVVATDVGGVREQIVDGKSGMVVGPGKPDLLAEAVLRILSSSRSTLDAMGREGRQRVEQVFSLGGVARKHRDIYQETIRD